MAALLLCGTGPAESGVLGVQPINDPLPFYDAAGNAVRDPRPGDVFPPMRVLLSRDRYWTQDRALDVVVQLAEPEGGMPRSELRVTLSDEAGRELSRHTLQPPGPRFIFHPEIPEALAEGGVGSIELAWIHHNRYLDRQTHSFRVEPYPETAPRSGSITLTIPNRTEAVAEAVPVTVGVPFPRGILEDVSHLRLVSIDDDERTEIPLQARETNRWAPYGTVKWVLCDFQIDLDGAARELVLEYGPEVSRQPSEPLEWEETDGFPAIQAGRLRFGDGLWFDPAGDGEYVRVLEESALHGAFVEHEDGRFYRVPGDAPYEIEADGPEKIVVKREGWYREEESGREFCKYVIRYIIHRESPMVRIFLSWIYTGDSNRDRIRNMGWQFALPEDFAGDGFLTAFGEEGGWAPGQALLQYAYDSFEVVDGEEPTAFDGGRAPGVARMEGPGVNLYFAARNFWQNYPSELEFRDGSFWFHNWPRHNKPARYSYDTGRLSRSEWKMNAVRLRFAHEGEMLDFRLPDEFAQDPIWQRATMYPHPGSFHWAKDDPESANAQGVSRTEEMWLYLTAAEDREVTPERTLEGWNEETLRATADPAWVAASGAFYEIHPQDWENFAEEERIFELVARAPGHLIERLGLYGMWIHGDIAAWNPSLDVLEPALYRAFRKGHHGWPYSWIPFARSGDPELLQLADAATRQMIDANWCHYAEETVDRISGPDYFRRKGWWHRSLVPWASRGGPSTRCYQSKSDFLWHAWFLTGYQRAHDLAMEWARETKREEELPRRGEITNHRSSITLLKSYLETYEATFDPWFLVAAHAIADGHWAGWQEGAWDGHVWDAGDAAFLRFTGRQEEYPEYFLGHVEAWGGDRPTAAWSRQNSTVLDSNAFAWRLTGDPAYLNRVAGALDPSTYSVYDGEEPGYFLGYTARDAGGTAFSIFTGWHLQQFPVALAALAEADVEPVPIYPSFVQMGAGVEPAEEQGGYRYRSPVIAVRKEADQAVPLLLSMSSTPRAAAEGETYAYRVTGPGGEDVLSGSWEIRERIELEIPADAPPGTYRIQTEGVSRWSPQNFNRRMRGLELPITPPGTAEVIELQTDEPMGRAAWDSQYWFMVPEGVERFVVDLPVEPQHGALRRMSVWSPDGELVWNHTLVTPGGNYQGESPVRAEIEVAPDQAGRLWRLTLPGRNSGFRMDPAIPSIYATGADRWFEP